MTNLIKRAFARVEPSAKAINALTGHKKMKTHVLLVSTRFLKGHIHEGHFTSFAEQIKCGVKVHTIRANYEFWKNRIDEISNGDAVLSIRIWEGVPYHSKQFEICRFTKCGIQKLVVGENNDLFIDGFKTDTNLVAHNDGLTREDFDSWFFSKPVKPQTEFALIHFSNTQKY